MLPIRESVKVNGGPVWIDDHPLNDHSLSDLPTKPCRVPPMANPTQNWLRTGAACRNGRVPNPAWMFRLSLSRLPLFGNVPLLVTSVKALLYV